MIRPGLDFHHDIFSNRFVRVVSRTSHRRFGKALVIASAFGLLLLGSSARAQFPSTSEGPGLSVSATESIDLKPQKIRLTMWIQAQGKDAKSAILALNKHKDKVSKDLEAMKAVKESVTFSASRLATAGDSDEQRMMQMRMRAMRSSGQNGADIKMPQVVTAKCAVKAEWPLPVQEGDALTILPAALREQVEARDLAGKENRAELSDEEKEQMDELEEMISESYGYMSSSDDENTPQIQFVGVPTPEETTAITKKTFDAAAAKAKSISDAAGNKTGKLLSVAMRFNDASEYLDMARAYAVYGSRSPSSMETGSGNEVLSDHVDELKYYSNVALVYTIE